MPMSWDSVKEWTSQNRLLMATIGGVLVGAATGAFFKSWHLDAEVIMLVLYPGELFMRLLRLMMLPLIVASLVSGCARLNARLNGKIAARTLAYFLATSFLNAALGTTIAVLMRPGRVTRPGPSVFDAPITDNRPRFLDAVLDLGRNIFTDNLVKAAFQQAHTVYVPVPDQAPQNDGNATWIGEVETVRSLQYRDGTNTLGIIFFCLVFGTILGGAGAKGRVLVEFFTAMDHVVMRMVGGLMWLTPIGVASVVCGKILSVEELTQVLQQLSWFVITVTLGVLFYQLLVLQVIYFIFIRRNPYTFYWRLIEATVTAFATASTAATLPVSFRCLDEKLRVDPRISRFVLPVGCNINMDGTALFVAAACVFVAQMSDISLTLGQLLTVCLVSTAASFSSASVPSAALVLIFMVLGTVEVPTRDVSLLFAVDWLVDRIRTTNNMLGDCYAAAVVQHLSREQLIAADTDILKGSGNGYVLPMTMDDVVVELPDNDSVFVDLPARNGSIRRM